MKIDSIKYRENLKIDETAQKDVIISGHYDGPSDAFKKMFPTIKERVLQLTNEAEMTEDEMVDSIGLPKYILSGSGPTDFTVGWPGPFEGLSLGKSLTNRVFMGVDPVQPETVVPVAYDTYGLKHPKADFILYAMKNKDMTIKTCYDLLSDEDPIALDNAIRRALQNESR